MAQTSPFRQTLLQTANDWWLFLIRGVVAIIFGLVAWVWPGLTLTALVVVFGAYAVVDGIFAIAAAVASSREDGQTRLLLGLGGLASIVLGILVWAWPGISTLTLLYLIAIWAIASGVTMIVNAIRYRREIEGELLLGLTGLASVIFGILVVIFPGSGALALTWMIGLYAIIWGAFLIAFAFRLRGLRGQIGSATRGNLAP